MKYLWNDEISRLARLDLRTVFNQVRTCAGFGALLIDVFGEFCQVLEYDIELVDDGLVQFVGEVPDPGHSLTTELREYIGILAD